MLPRVVIPPASAASRAARVVVDPGGIARGRSFSKLRWTCGIDAARQDELPGGIDLARRRHRPAEASHPPVRDADVLLGAPLDGDHDSPADDEVELVIVHRS